MQKISKALTMLLADAFALSLKTKNFCRHMSGASLHEYCSMLDEQSTEILAMTDELASRVRKIGGSTLRSVSHVGRLQRVTDKESQWESPRDALAELRTDNIGLANCIRATHSLCRELVDVASTSLLGSLIDKAEGRIWVLFEASNSRHGATPRSPDRW